MINEPIVVWPPGTFYMDCGTYGSYFDCSYDYPQLASVGLTICCPA